MSDLDSVETCQPKGSACKVEMAGIMPAIMKGLHWFSDHILVLNHLPIGPMIKSETTTLWSLEEDSLTDYFSFLNFNRFFFLPSLPQTLWDLLEGSANVLLNLFKTIIEMSEKRKTSIG